MYAPASPPEETSILLVAEHALVRAGLRAVLGGTPGLAVVAETAALDGAAALAERHRPDVVLLHEPPAGAAGELAVAELRRAVPTACLLRARCPAPRVEVALSRRERQVAVRVAAGLTSKQIAAALGVSLRTVNTYRESLARKLGASSPAVLTRYVLEHGLHGESPALG